MEKKEEKTLPYKIAIFGAFSTIVLTALYDWIKAKPLMSTLFLAYDWFWHKVLLHRFPVWNILAAIITAYLFEKLRKKFFTRKPEFVQYESDIIKGYKYAWNWKKKSDGKWAIENLHVMCEKCDTETFERYSSGFFLGEVECPRCDHRMTDISGRAKIATIITDNLKGRSAKKPK